MNSYIQLNSVSQAALRLAVLHGTWQQTVVSPKAIHRGIGGKGVIQFMPTYYACSFLAKVYLSPPANYASQADVKTWFSATTTNGRTLTFVDPYNVSRTVALTSDWTPEEILVMHDATGAFHLVPFTLEQIG